MTIDPNEANRMLAAVAGTEKRTREFLVYARAGDYMILWGILLAIGYALSDGVWPQTYLMWWIIQAVGVTGTAILTWRVSRCRPEHSRYVFVKPLVAICVLIAFGTFWIHAAHFASREQAFFWPTFCGALLFCFGLWAGRTLSIGAAALIALTLAGYFWSGVWFDPWLAVTCGGALILGGLWLRR